MERKKNLLNAKRVFIKLIIIKNYQYKEIRNN